MKKETFDQLWKNVILPNAKRYVKQYPDHLSFDENKKYIIWESYEKASVTLQVKA